MNILIIDDDLDFAESLKDELEDAPDLFVVNSLSSREAALNFFTAPAFSTIECILLDLQFPLQHGETVDDGAGMKVLRDLRSVYGFDKTIIVMTSSTKISDAQNGLAAGCDGYMMKCGTIRDIETMIDELKQALSNEEPTTSGEFCRIFWRDKISPKEAKMLDLLLEDEQSDAPETSRNSVLEAVDTNDVEKIFDKLLAQRSISNFTGPTSRKRELALQIWKAKRQKAS